MNAPPRRVFFTDRDLGISFPSILAAAGLRVERHADHFTPTTSDATWLRVVGIRGWTVITHNERIRYVPNEKRAVKRYRVGMLVVVGKAPIAELAHNFVASLARIENFLEGRPTPFIGKVYRPTPAELKKDPSAKGRVELWYPEK